MPSKLEILRQLALRQKGAYGAQRVERAADEIKNLTKLYSPSALSSAFLGDNAKALMTMNPKDFERYATPLVTRTSTLGRKVDPDIIRRHGEKMGMTTDDYLKTLQKVRGGFADVPYLEINKERQGSAVARMPLTPYISGHEGRHRNRAMAASGEQVGLVRLEPERELKYPFPSRSQEEYIEALREELGMTGNRVVPQRDYDATSGTVIRPEIDLPPIYKQGGEVSQDAMRMAVMNQKVQHKVRGGLNLAEMKKSAQDLWDIAKGTRSRAAQEAAGLYHPIGGSVKMNTPVPLMDFKTIKDPNVKMAPLKIITPESLYGGRGIPLIGDRALAGRIVTDIGGNKVNVVGEGGPNYIRTHSRKDPAISAAWAAGDAKTTNLAKVAGETGDPVYGINVIGSPTNVDFNTMVTKAILDQYDPSAVTDANKKAFAQVLRTYVPDAKKPHLIPGANFVGMDDVDAMREQLMAPGAGNLRKAFTNRLNIAKFRDMGFPDVAHARLATTEPALVDSPIGMAGFTVAKMDTSGNIIEAPVREHTTYPVSAGGSYYGSLDEPVDYQDIFQRFGLYRRGAGANPKDDYRSFSLSPQIQDFDQQWLDNIMKTLGRDKPSVSEYKDGGAVNMKGGSLVDELIAKSKGKTSSDVKPQMSRQSGKPPTFSQDIANRKTIADMRAEVEANQRAVDELYGRYDRPEMSIKSSEPNYVTPREKYVAPNVEALLNKAGMSIDSSRKQSETIKSLLDWTPGATFFEDARNVGDAARQGRYLDAFGNSLIGGASLLGAGALAKNVLAPVARGAKAVGKSLAPKIGDMAENYMIRTGAMLPMVTYQGSPHRFLPTKKNSLGELDPTKIGTGEGAQAYGYGHYLAENPAVANEYRRTLRDMNPSYDGVPVNDTVRKTAAELLMKAKGDKAAAIKDAQNYAFDNLLIPEINKMDASKVSYGALYHVDLPDEHIAKMLDWDKPLSQQPQAFKDAVSAREQQRMMPILEQRRATLAGLPEGAENASILKKQIAILEDEIKQPQAVPNMTGGEYFNYLRNREMAPAEQADWLRKAGIPGIRYLDGGSRNVGEGTSNFVVFPGNENMTNIIKREKKGGAIHKADGGITSDDLILEERLL